MPNKIVAALFALTFALIIVAVNWAHEKDEARAEKRRQCADTCLKEFGRGCAPQIVYEECFCGAAVVDTK